MGLAVAGLGSMPLHHWMFCCETAVLAVAEGKREAAPGRWLAVAEGAGCTREAHTAAVGLQQAAACPAHINLELLEVLVCPDLWSRFVWTLNTVLLALY